MRRRESLIVLGAGVVTAVLMMAAIVWAGSADGPDLGKTVVVPRTPGVEVTSTPGGRPTVRETKAEPVKPPPPRRGGDDDDDDGGDDD